MRLGDMTYQEGPSHSKWRHRIGNERRVCLYEADASTLRLLKLPVLDEGWHRSQSYTKIVPLSHLMGTPTTKNNTFEKECDAVMPQLPGPIWS
jgi:hypothetical protein